MAVGVCGGVIVGVAVGVGAGVFVGVLVAVGMGVAVGSLVGLEVGVGVKVGVAAGCGVNVAVVVGVGVAVATGAAVTVGVDVGDRDADPVDSFRVILVVWVTDQTIWKWRVTSFGSVFWGISNATISLGNSPPGDNLLALPRPVASRVGTS